MSKREPIYKVIFINQGQVYEMYAKQIYQSDLWGFLEVEEFVFGERTQVVVDPSEEKLKAQFEGVVRSFVPVRTGPQGLEVILNLSTGMAGFRRLLDKNTLAAVDDGGEIPVFDVR